MSDKYAKFQSATWSISWMSLKTILPLYQTATILYSVQSLVADLLCVLKHGIVTQFCLLIRFCYVGIPDANCWVTEVWLLCVGSTHSTCEERPGTCGPGVCGQSGCGICIFRGHRYLGLYAQSGSRLYAYITVLSCSMAYVAVYCVLQYSAIKSLHSWKSTMLFN